VTTRMPVQLFTHVEAFQANLQRVCGRFSVNPIDRSGQMKGRISLSRSSGIDIASIGADVDRAVRTRKDIKGDHADYFFLIVQSKGRALMCQETCKTLLREGDMFLVDSALPSAFAFHGRYSQQISLHLPRDSMIGRFGARIYGGIDLRREDDLSVAMRSVLNRMLEGSYEDRGRLSEAFLSVLGAYLVGRADRPQLGENRSLLAAALRAIDLHHSDPEFCPRKLADHLGVSLRKLQREFKQIEETPRRRLMAVRLTAAHEALRRRLTAAGPQTVTAIAYAHGFNDLSYFYREFRNRYGLVPGEAVAGAAAAD
jgi:AraC family transcriptional regulator, positive regulator of tynA and feaB